MKKRNIYKFIAVTVFLIIIFLGLRDTLVDFEYKKITKSSDLPLEIKQALAEGDLERGVYFFSNIFTKEDAYVVICAGNKYPEGYDVDIENYTYHSIVKDEEEKSIYGYYEINIVEKSSSTTYDYSKNHNYPLVVFKITGNAKRFWVKINSEQELKVNDWWGDAKKTVNNKTWSFEVINSKNLYPQFINENFSIKWGDVLGYCVPGKTADKRVNYIIIAGKKGEPSFNVSVDVLDWREELVVPGSHSSIKQKTFDMIIRKDYSKEFSFEHQSIPFNLIKVQYNKSLDALWPRNIIFLDKHLNWEKIKQ